MGSGGVGSKRIAVVGLAGGARQLSAAARRAIEGAALLVGAARHLDRVGRGPLVPEKPRPVMAEPELTLAAEAVPGAQADEAPPETEPATDKPPPETEPPPVTDADAPYAPFRAELSADALSESDPATDNLPPRLDPADADAAPVVEPAAAAEPPEHRPRQRVIVLGADWLDAGAALDVPGAAAAGAGPGAAGAGAAGALDVAEALDAIGAETGPVCVLASGDPGFFGIVRPLVERFGVGALDVHPAPSSVSLAFARLGLAWDDAVVVSTHGRPLASAARAILAHPKVAVLTSPQAAPQQLGRALMDLGVDPRRVAVCSHLGEPDEVVRETDLVGLAGRSWDPLSVVVLLAAGAEVSSEAVLAWGLADEGFAHRGGMLTRAEVRAVALGKLALPAQGVLWDVGASSGSVAVECARLRPGLRVIAVEERQDDAARVAANALAHRASVEVVQGSAPDALAGLPDPDRAFVGGGGLPVLDAVLARLRPGGQVVATYAALDRAAAAVERLGQLVQIGVARGRRLPDGGVRLAAENPIFVVWGPQQ